MKSPIYLDYNASTPLDRDVFDAAVKQLKEGLGNPSSIHSFGKNQRHKIVSARHTIADCLGVYPREIIFTSGGTEGMNMLLRGIVQGQLTKKVKPHLITSTIEHPCAFETAKVLEKQGITITYLKPNPEGVITPESLEEAMSQNPTLIALSSANSETGVLQDYEAYAKIAESHNIPLIVDAVALLGKEAVTIPKGVSGMVFSGQKIGACLGSGFIFLRKGERIIPQITGGPQEFGVRAGSENIASIVGLSLAVKKVLTKPLTKDTAKLRDMFEKEILSLSNKFYVHGQNTNRLKNTSNICFNGIDGEWLLLNLDEAGVAASLGSACSSGAIEPSRVLLEMGVSPEEAFSSLRFSLGRETTHDEIKEVVARIYSLIANCDL